MKGMTANIIGMADNARPTTFMLRREGQTQWERYASVRAAAMANGIRPAALYQAIAAGRTATVSGGQGWVWKWAWRDADGREYTGW